MALPLNATGHDSDDVPDSLDPPEVIARRAQAAVRAMLWLAAVEALAAVGSTWAALYTIHLIVAQIRAGRQ